MHFLLRILQAHLKLKLVFHRQMRTFFLPHRQLGYADVGV